MIEQAIRNKRAQCASFGALTPRADRMRPNTRRKRRFGNGDVDGRLFERIGESSSRRCETRDEPLEILPGLRFDELDREAIG